MASGKVTQGSGKQPAMATFGRPVRRSAPRRSVSLRAAYEFALEYAKERHAFGKPIIMNQAIAFKLANMITEIDASRLLIWRAAWLARNGGYKNAEGSQSKWKASETAVRDRGGHPDPRRLRLHLQVPRRALAPTPRSTPSSKAPARSSNS
ncbi:MAG: acyl-CoA dehydrogenase family protein [Ilumatobacteraceae bacterium]